MRNHIKITSVLLALILAFSIYAIVPFSISAAVIDPASLGATIDQYNNSTPDQGTFYGIDPAYPDFIYVGIERLHDISDDDENDQEVSIYKYIGHDKEVTVPSALDGFTVTGIERSAFRDCDDPEIINIPATVYRIDTETRTGGFHACSSLKEINVDENNSVFQSIDGVLYSKGEEQVLWICPLGKTEVNIAKGTKYIAMYAFSNCAQLSRVVIPSGVESIGYNAFYRCSSLADIELPDTLKSIGSNAFSNCDSLEEILFPDSLTDIGDSAFYRCSSLKSICIPASVTDIGESVFENCSGLESADILTAFQGCVPGVIPYCLFNRCTALKKVTLPEGITKISYYAFSYCSALEIINIPTTVTVIGDGAFYGCTSLRNIVFPEGIFSVGDEALGDTAWYDDQPGGLIYIGKVAYSCKGECPSKVNLAPDTVAISDRAFYECDTLQEIVLSNTLEEIGSSAFAYCVNLDGIKLPSSLKRIEYDVFYSCEKLKNVVIPDSVTEIGGGSFCCCTSLESVELSKNCTQLPGFSGCSALESIEIPNAVTEINPREFYDCTSLKNVVIPNSVIMIGSDAFENCTSLKSLTIPYSVDYIMDHAFGFNEELNIEYIDEDNQIWHYDIVPVPDFTVCGYAGSEAERYADENGFTFITIGYINTDEDTSVSVISEEDVMITVQDLTYDYEEENLYIAYDITLSKDGETVRPEGEVTVRIPWWYSPYAKVYRVEADGSRTNMNAVYRDWYLQFTTDHFSVYLIFEGTSPVMLGDVDGDEAVTSMDASAIQRYLAGMAVWYFDEAAADVDGDGEIASIDATWIQRYVADMPAPEGIDKPIEND